MRSNCVGLLSTAVWCPWARTHDVPFFSSGHSVVPCFRTYYLTSKYLPLFILSKSQLSPVRILSACCGIWGVVNFLCGAERRRSSEQNRPEFSVPSLGSGCVCGARSALRWLGADQMHGRRKMSDDLCMCEARVVRVRISGWCIPVKLAVWK